MTTKKEENKSLRTVYLPPLVAGAVAGLSVDVALYPLDTLKTRLQSEKGFQKAGGFRGVYRGVLTVATSSMPTSSLFFMSYEMTKALVLPHVATTYAPLVHMLAASIGEVAYKTEGLRRGVYRGFLSTVARDLPFSFIELPVWELLKTTIKNNNNGQITSFQSAVCGSIAGGFAAAATTPLDLAKTRIMLAEQCSLTAKMKIRPVLASIYYEAGIKGLFAGVTPRMTAFMIGGFVFFGVYDDVKKIVENYLGKR